MREHGRALVLIGFMGTGKSSVGREVGRRLGVPRFDTDEMVRLQFGMPVGQIFEEFGEAKFREAESDALRQLDGEGDAVLVTGGGIVLREENIETLRRLGMIVNLFAREEVVFERISRRPARPLLKTADPRATVVELMRAREPLYRAIADSHIDTSDLSHADVATRLIEQWQGVGART